MTPVAALPVDGDARSRTDCLTRVLLLDLIECRLPNDVVATQKMARFKEAVAE